MLVVLTCPLDVSPVESTFLVVSGVTKVLTVNFSGYLAGRAIAVLVKLKAMSCFFIR